MCRLYLLECDPSWDIVSFTLRLKKVFEFIEAVNLFEGFVDLLSIDSSLICYRFKNSKTHKETANKGTTRQPRGQVPCEHLQSTVNPLKFGGDHCHLRHHEGHFTDSCAESTQFGGHHPNDIPHIV